MISRFLIIVSTLCIIYIAAQDTINSIVFGEDIIELVESAKKEKEENRENELREEFEFINHQLALLSASLKLNASNYNPYSDINSYNSPIQIVITPPPDHII